VEAERHRVRRVHPRDLLERPRVEDADERPFGGLVEHERQQQAVVLLLPTPPRHEHRLTGAQPCCCR
jgi:hypothetical protein